MNHEHGAPEGPNRQDRNFKWVFGGFLVIALFFLLTEHRAHFFGILPWLLILACPLLHMFGHGHGGHGGHRHGDTGGSSGKEP